MPEMTNTDLDKLNRWLLEVYDKAAQKASVIDQCLRDMSDGPRKRSLDALRVRVDNISASAANAARVATEVARRAA
jgi:hypothetical protein